MKRLFLIVTVFILLSPLNLFAQDSGSFPAVSQIRLEHRNNLIRITWTDSPDARGPVYIYRSARPFSGSIPANLRPVVVRYGMQYYIDDIDDVENVHYFIAASDVSGHRYEVIIPRINSASVNLSGAPPSQPFPGISPAEAQDNISHLRAVRDGERVIISYNASNPRRNVILYRSVRPINRISDLIDAVVIQSGFGSPFVDFPLHGMTWYYAVIFEDEIAGGNVRITPGINATTSPVTISISDAGGSFIRPIPLPVLSLHDSGSHGYLTDVSRSNPLSSESASMLRESRVPSKPPLELRWPRVFESDLMAPATGEETALFQIINESFSNFKWEDARNSLQRYLSLPRTPEIEARARFYLGQTLYYTGNYRDALMEFLKFRAFQPVEANIWIEAVLTAMVY